MFEVALLSLILASVAAVAVSGIHTLPKALPCRANVPHMRWRRPDRANYHLVRLPVMSLKVRRLGNTVWLANHTVMRESNTIPIGNCILPIYTRMRRPSPLPPRQVR